MATNKLRDVAQENNNECTDFKAIKKRTIIARFEIEDNDCMELGLYNYLKCESLKDFTKLPDTDHLYKNDKVFRELATKRKQANRAYNDYINKTKIK